MYLYFLNKQNIDLSVAEVLSLANAQKHEIADNCLLLDELVDYKRLAYTKKVLKLLFSSSKKNFLKDFKNYDFNNDYKESFRLELINNKNYNIGSLADIIWDNLKNPKADMKNPKTSFEIIFSKKIFVCKLIYENKEKFEERKAHLRPFNHPTSLHPRLARCFVNLANSEEILDPFCGSAGILIEAGLIGLKTTGYDTDEIMLKRAKKNLDSFKIKNYAFEKQDALKINKSFEAIVTDLPYGKNSKVKDLEKTIIKFLTNSFNFVKKMIVVFPDFVDSKKIIEKTSWKINKNFDYYIHKSLTKKIFVLGK